MAKVKIEVLSAVIDGHQTGEQLEVSESDAKNLVAIGYAKEVSAAKAEPKPKAKAKK